MSSKVFLFENDHWLYCSDVTFEDGVYTGWVVNGAWKMQATDTTIKSTGHSYETKMIWACNPNTTARDYNSVIENARERYAAGEPANFKLKPKPVYEDDDEVPF